MTDLEAVSRLMDTLLHLEKAMACLKDVDGMLSAQESIADLCWDLEMELEELVSICG
jgi:hypothetical protein